MDELIERVRVALAAEYSGAPNGRVRDVPDRRAIRWYTTIGLVDRPLGMRGRTAIYGPRHLQQLVAIKRWQAEGRSLAQIQADFTWLTAEGLADAARVPGHLLEEGNGASGSGAPKPDIAFRRRFWADAPTETAIAPDIDGPVEAAERLLPAGGPASERPVPAAPGDTPAAVHGVVLGDGVVLLLPYPVSDTDRAEIAAAAAPLMTMLESRGLIVGRTS
ncbi:MerR family transcriptional regulator [Actinoplanes sp. CA-030573]|uniref:MerR family transcriptional regulator n=1 Tax=Actinoplanes sp. CA-030573 TaxID=3239898 RepID=UPI003D908369